MLELIISSNFILSADTYKYGHWEEILAAIFPVKKVWAVVVPRKASDYSDEIVAAGHALVAQIIANVRITPDMIDEAELEITQQGYRFNRRGWEIIEQELHGRLPLAVYGVEEGRVVKPQTPILGITNTDDRFAWLPTYVETWVQEIMWKMSTVATISRVCYKTFEHYTKLSGGDMSMVEYKMQNFGDRGADSPDEAPVMAGLSHAMLFSGSDCGRVNRLIKRLYNTGKAYTSSVEATEHATMCLHSDAEARDDFGAACMLVDRLYEAVIRSKEGIGLPIVSGVIDTYDDERFVREYLCGPLLKPRIIASGGRLVARPDTGEPKLKSVQVLNWLEEGYGTTLNAAGYKNLPPCVGMIYGDKNNVRTFRSVIDAIVVGAGYCTDNFLLGMGSGFTHDGGRDDFSFSMKAVAASDGSRWTRLLKAPKSDMGKVSLSGLVRCREDENGELEVYDAMDGSLFDFTDGGAGWQLYVQDSHRVFRQSFDNVRSWARK